MGGVIATIWVSSLLTELMSNDKPPTEQSFGQRGLDRRNVLKGIGAGVGLGVTGALATDPVSALGFDEIVEINIKPSSNPNAINCKSRGGTPVAILTTDDFDATTVDPSSLRFGKPTKVAAGDGAEFIHKGGHTEDVDDDGDMDFVGHFDTQDTGFTADDTEGWLVGKSKDGRRIMGMDSVKIVGKCPDEEEEGRPEVSVGTPVKQTIDGVPEAGPGLEDPITPPEGYKESEEALEEWKERAKNGNVPQPKRGEIQSEGGNFQASGTNSSENSSTNEITTQQAERIDPGIGYAGWENSDLRATPPDSNIAVGPSKTVLAANLRWGIYDKFGGGREFEVELADWWDPVLPETETFVFDPKALYDHHSDRFILIAVARDSERQQSSWVVAVSDDGNPYGTWWITRIPHGVEGEWVDYPGFGVDKDGIYLTANIFAFSGGFQESKIVSIDKTPLYNGNSFTYWWWSDVRAHNGGKAFTIQPTHDMPSTSSGRNGSQWLVSSTWNSGDTLTLYRITNPTSSPLLFRYKVDVGDYALPPNAEQPGTTATLDTGDARLLNAMFENGSLWTVHSITYDWGGDGDAEALMKWYEIDVSSRSQAQARGWGRPDADYFKPAIASDGDSTMIVYNESGPQTFPRIEVAGRTSGHTQNSLEDVAVLRFGESSVGASGNFRWGDYAGIVVDPGEEVGGYWSYSQYGNNEETLNDWETWVENADFEQVIIE